MARYTALLREMGFGPPRRSVAEDIQAQYARHLRAITKPSPLAKAMPGLERKIATGLRRLRQIEQRQPVRDVHYYRAEFARMDRQATDMAKAGEISIQQASTLDNLLHRYAMEHLL